MGKKNGLRRVILALAVIGLLATITPPVADAADRMGEATALDPDATIEAKANELEEAEEEAKTCFICGVALAGAEFAISCVGVGAYVPGIAATSS